MENGSDVRGLTPNFRIGDKTLCGNTEVDNMLKGILAKMTAAALALGLSGSSRAAQQNDFGGSITSVQSLIERYDADRTSLSHVYDAPLSEAAETRLTALYADWSDALRKVNFDELDEENKVDYLLFDNHLRYQLRLLDIRKEQEAKTLVLLSFSKIIVNLDESRRRMEIPKPEEAAAALAELIKQIAKSREAAEAGLQANAQPTQAPGAVQPVHVSKIVASRAAETLPRLREVLKRWFQYYNGYHPLFTWWASEPYKEADRSLEAYTNFVKEKLVGIKADDKTTIIGDPVGRDALAAELTAAMVPYSPEELIALAENEMDWCQREMSKASHEMGYDDWHKALEHVKGIHVEPGDQPEAIRKLAIESINYVEGHDLVSVPQLAKETWRMEMMSPERQLVNPFFTGGDVISVSYPTDAMTFEQRIMTMKGNNISFSRATVFHELIPGHYLQQFMNERYRTYRRVFQTPFWSEGNAFYWELLLWNIGFPKTPEERAGMLFWRMHRCARIIFSLKFHLGLWTPQQCVEFLVTKVGHEVDNATAEVRRSFNGSVPPLYQSAYMIGALQFRALHAELVDSGKMTNRAFHDRILRENQMPVEMVRAILTDQKLNKDFHPNWKFYGPIPARGELRHQE